MSSANCLSQRVQRVSSAAGSSNFFRSEGMPYGDDYLHGLWEVQKAACRIFETGCPEGSHW